MVRGARPDAAARRGRLQHRVPPLHAGRVRHGDRSVRPCQGACRQTGRSLPRRLVRSRRIRAVSRDQPRAGRRGDGGPRGPAVRCPPHAVRGLEGPHDPRPGGRPPGSPGRGARSVRRGPGLLRGRSQRHLAGPDRPLQGGAARARGAGRGPGPVPLGPEAVRHHAAHGPDRVVRRPAGPPRAARRRHGGRGGRHRPRPGGAARRRVAGTRATGPRRARPGPRTAG